FDPTQIDQFGFNFQWARIRHIMTNLAPSSYYDAETGVAELPQEWRDAAQWYWNALWDWNISPYATYQAAELLQPSGFASGNIGISVTPLWYTCCLDNSVGNFNWDIAPVPASFDGEQHVAMDADTFRIIKTTPNPEAAF